MKKILAMMLSILMVVTMLPMQIFAAEDCNHMITPEIWDTLSESIKENNPDKEPNVNGNGNEVPAFVGVELPASCDSDGWYLAAGEDHGFCFLCGETVPADEHSPEYETIPATGHHFVETDAATCTKEGTETCDNFKYSVKAVGAPGSYEPLVEKTPCAASQKIEKLAHEWGEWEVTTPATCTENGVETRTCLSDAVTTETRDIEALGHTWDKGVVTAPTCEADGYTTLTCTVCGETDKVDIVPAIGHNWSEWVVTKAASCAEAGVETRVCQNDKAHVETRTVAKLDHTFGEVTSVPATCTEAGYDTKTCTACGYESRVETAPALGHLLGDDAVVEEAPTCTKDGIAVGTCTRCGERQVRTVIEALGHDWLEWEVTTPATCTETGVETQKCSRCDETNTKDIPALGHDWLEWEVTTPATCTETGVETQKCSRCDETNHRDIPALGHDWGEWTVTKAPTCTEDGSQQSICKNDDTHIKTETLPATGHVWDEGVVTAPTCTKDGYTTFTCKVCGESEQRDVTSKLGHNPDMDNVVVVKAPTCEADGYNEAPCTRCSNIIRIIVPAIGHDFVPTVVAPGCESQGYTEYVCQNDNSHKYRTDYVDPLGHDWDEGVITKDAACEETGTKIYTCNRDASHTYEETLPAIGHAWEVSEVVAPTCTEEGYTLYVCQNDPTHSYKGNFVDAVGHNWGEWTVTKAPTCTETGVETRVCLTEPSHVETREIEMVEHQFTAERESYPTCTEQGVVYYTCQVCGLIKISKEEATGHNFDDTSDYDCLHGKYCSNINRNTGEVCGAEDSDRDYSVEFTENVKSEDGKYYVEGYDFDYDTDIVSTGHVYNWVLTPSTCEENAYWTGTCVNTREIGGGAVLKCDESRENHTVVIECKNTAIGHNWSLLDDGSNVPPTCTEDGVRHYICLNDRSHTYTETIPALTHNFVLSDTVPATCTEGGYNLYVCEREGCEATYKEYITAKLPHNYVVTDTVAATCTEEGYEVYTCTECKDTYNKVTTPVIPHQLSETVTLAETCTTNGIMTHQCKACDYSYTTVIPARGHNYGKTEVVAPTCTAQGYTVHSCTNPDCDDYYVNDYTNKINHVLSVESSVKPSCEEDGYVLYTCSNCDYSYKEIISATGHNYGKVYVVAPTCTAQGYTMHICTNADCADFYRNDYTNKTEHVLSVVSTVPATCGTDGTVTYACANCDYSYNEVIPATGNHKYSDEITTAATCGTDGVMTHKCDACDYSYTTVIPATGDHRYEDVVVTAATCGTDGVMTHQCKACEYSYTTVIPATGDHRYDDVVVTAATCTTDGVMIHQCKACDYNYTTVIPATGHNYGDVKVVDATCTAGGYTEYTCTNPGCTDSYKTELTDKVDHVMRVTKTVDATCTKDGKVTYTCENCGYSYDEIIQSVGHKYGPRPVHTSPTCVAAGFYTYVCENCGYAYMSKTEERATGHKLTTSVTKKATNKSYGIITTSCKNKGCNYKTTKKITPLKSIRLSKTEYVYTGETRKPSVTVWDKDNKKVSKSYYTVSYSNNKNIGTAKVTIKFKGKYSGTYTRYFKIIPKNVAISVVSSAKKQIKFTWGKIKVCDRYQIQYSTSKTFKSAKTVNIKSQKTCSYTFKNLKKGKTYYIRIRAVKKAGGKNYYSNWTTTKKVCR